MYTTIRVEEDVRKRLEELKIHPRQTLNEVIKKLLPPNKKSGEKKPPNKKSEEKGISKSKEEKDSPTLDSFK